MRANARCLLVLLSIAVGAAPQGVAQVRPQGPSRAPQRNEPTATASDAAPQPKTPRGGAAGRATGAPQGREAAPQNAGPKAPFNLTEGEQKLLDLVLVKWEQQSAKIKTFKCDFDCWEYDPTFGDATRDNLKSESTGYIKFKAPDRGEYAVSKVTEFNFQKKIYQPRTENLDRWMCDGKSIFEFNAKKKQVIERKLPPELHGKAISDGPLPFVFGAKADDLKRRYWMRDVTPKTEVGKSIWLEARPKYQQDAANFERATVILSEGDFMPSALQIALPGGAAPPAGADGRKPDATRQEANTAYSFKGRKVNDPFGVFDFLAPRTPLGWKHVVEEPPGEPQKTSPATQAPSDQAQRPSPPARRK